MQPAGLAADAGGITRDQQGVMKLAQRCGEVSTVIEYGQQMLQGSRAVCPVCLQNRSYVVQLAADVADVLTRLGGRGSGLVVDHRMTPFRWWPRRTPTACVRRPRNTLSAVAETGS
ncbi:hypothetical protein WN71_018310 [Streptomyces mangrovisoli]|uniref:Uncharacterized protein n=1 Tax=Streptomyces mangrovisoli TaxID=1428628 RepID=A0A1J4NVE0_9ACTN|nr:hypothetical protein WN71_018310 [Streptomyces mangrovisoli]